ncbi:MAG: gas vesicle protein GvpN [candidate division Zixibacteria bacterium]|nr:gas vesicle protein GvpN [candidate division Zixibacteria bacterium]
MIEESTAVLEPSPLPDFVETKAIKEITERALAYVKAGFPVHFRGPTGTGKTSLAMHVAGKIGRPVVMLHGDEELTTSDLVGRESGYKRRKFVDQYISRVYKLEETAQKSWVDHRLTVACKHGLTLIYDEFTRSRPETNNVLLSILQEKMMTLPDARGEESYLKIHPDFCALFTSNPEEYAGVHKGADALRDRMITIDLDHFDQETEIAITKAKSDGLNPKGVEKIVNVVRGLRAQGRCEFAPTVRASVMIARTLGVQNIPVSAKNKEFVKICEDILASETSRIGKKIRREKVKAQVRRLVLKYC